MICKGLLSGVWDALSTVTAFPFTVSTLVLLGKLDGCTRGSCSQLSPSQKSSVSGRLSSMVSTLPYSVAWGPAAAKAPGFFLILIFVGCAFL